MALLLRLRGVTLVPSASCLLNRVGIQCSSTAAARSMASDSNKLNGDGEDDVRLTVTDDRSTIVCWHPKSPTTDHPYAHTLPYEDFDNPTVFKLENVIKGENLYLKKPPNYFTLEQVQALTYTPRHVWNRKRFEGLQMRPDHPRKGP